MKKLTAFLLALTLMLSIGVAAFADGDYQTITTTVAAPTWEMVIPKDVTIPCGQTEISIGHADIRLTNGSTLRSNDLIYVAIKSEQKLYNSDKTKFIPFYLTIPQFKNGTTRDLTPAGTAFPMAEEVGWLGLRGVTPDGYEDRYDEPYTDDVLLHISESAWNSADYGTYKAEIIYSSALVQK